MKKKPAKKKLQPHTGPNLQIVYEHFISNDQFMRMTLILFPTTEISVYGKNPEFIWESRGEKNVIRVTIPRQTSEMAATYTDNFPNGFDADRGSTINQLYDEIRRVLRNLD